MTYLDTDKQTYADLSITETANNEQFLFSLFSKTETKEGKSLMMNWVMYPLSDLDMIRKRQEAVAWDALPELLLNEEELDFIEYYLAYRDQIREAHVLLSCATVIDRLLRYDSTRYVICRGVKLVIHLLHCLERWAKELDEDAPQLMKESAPLQVFSKDALKNLHALQVSDAVKHFAGVTVKDYGGIGGLKTVSIRSLGAQHTAVGYDGITLTDCQTGQIDIGRFSLDNVDRLSLNNGQSDNIFQPARFFASAGILNIQTLTPLFTKGKKTNIAGAFKTGSWGLINPSLLLEQQFNKTWSMSANGEWMSSDGHYPYTLHYGNAAEDLSSREKRKNTDVQTFRAEAGLYGNFSDKEQWRLKAYYFQSSRGLPKATTFYNDHSTQHLWDKNTFIQSQYKKEFSRQWVFQTSAKWNWSYQRYLDPDTKNSLKKTENSYYQQEYYLSASVLYRLLSNLSFSLSTDGSINTMNADLANFVHPTRYSWLTAFAGKYVNDWLTISASALATVINEDVKKGGSAGNHRKLTPYVSAAFKPFRHEEFRVRFFYKDIFRLASFNDLYYEEVGNTQLKPEKAKQYNIGLTYNKNVCPFLPYLSVTVDAYYNKVTDKIIAYPTKNLAVWSLI